jgi:hypothetical protein
MPTYVIFADAEYNSDMLDVVGHCTYLIVGYGAELVDAFIETIMPSPPNTPKVVPPRDVDKTPPWRRPVLNVLSNQRSRVVLVKSVPGAYWVKYMSLVEPEV